MEQITVEQAIQYVREKRGEVLKEVCPQCEFYVTTNGRILKGCRPMRIAKEQRDIARQHGAKRFVYSGCPESNHICFVIEKLEKE